MRRSSASHSRRSSKIVSCSRLVPLAWLSRTDVGDWRSVASPGYGAVSMSRALNERSAPSEHATSIRSRPQAMGTPMSVMTSRNEPRYSHGAPSRVTSPPVTAAATTKVPVSIRSDRTRCSAPRSRRWPLTTIVSGAARSISAPIFWSITIKSSISGSRAAGRVTVFPPPRVGAGIAFWFAHDPPAKARQERSEQNEAGAHLRRGLERHEEPLDIACGHLISVRRRVVDDHSEVAQHVCHDAHVLDLGHIREAAPLAGQRRRGEQLERGVLAAADLYLAAQRAAAGHTKR